MRRRTQRSGRSRSSQFASRFWSSQPRLVKEAVAKALFLKGLEILIWGHLSSLEDVGAASQEHGCEGLFEILRVLSGF